MVMSGLLALPEDCIAAVIALTSPRDACRLACVSSTFRSAADSFLVWDRFLSSSSSSSSGSSSLLLSKKELYLRACHNPVLINEGKLSFWLDKPSGKKCYMISARSLHIAWGDNPEYWEWISVPEARFPEVAEVRGVSWFEIRGEITTLLLSPMTTYVAYLVFKPFLELDEFEPDDEEELDPDEFETGFENNPVQVTLGLAGSNGQEQTVYLDTTRKQQQEEIVQLHPRRGDDHGCFPEKRGDGWFESELGEYFYGGDEDSQLSITILEIKTGEMKFDLIFQGIEIRPKNE